ncbi:hypothetical protein WCU37_24170 [Serratia marcescens]|uniref:hypothetical protein n=1 Tax=Serratia marcescens TaxID=615 RepID=UPI0030CB8F21
MKMLWDINPHCSFFALSYNHVYKYSTEDKPMRKTDTRPILIDRESMALLHRIQERERSKSDLGVAPSIQDIARSVLRKALLKEAV